MSRRRASGNRRKATGRRLAVPGAVLALVVAGTALAFVLRHGKAGQGPLSYQGFVTRDSGPVEIGQLFTWGNVVLRNHGSAPATLDGVTLVGAPEALHLVHALTATPTKRCGLVGFIRQFPPKFRGCPAFPLRSVAGRVLGPHGGPDDDVEVVLVFRLTHPGTFTVQGVSVRYHSGGRSYVAEYPQRLTACAPLDRFPHGCPLA